MTELIQCPYLSTNPFGFFLNDIDCCLSPQVNNWQGGSNLNFQMRFPPSYCLSMVGCFCQQACFEGVPEGDQRPLLSECITLFL